jgi:hypothetical protein
LLGIGFHGVIDTAHPAVEIDAASGALDGQQGAAAGASWLAAVHDQSFQLFQGTGVRCVVSVFRFQHFLKHGSPFKGFMFMVLIQLRSDQPRTKYPEPETRHPTPARLMLRDGKVYAPDGALSSAVFLAGR